MKKLSLNAKKQNIPASINQVKKMTSVLCYLNWKGHIKHIENKIAKNLGLLYKARPFLERNALLALYYSYIQTYINYANIALGSTCRTNLQKINSQQKHAIRIIFNKNKFAHTREIFKEQKILNIYQLNILSNV